MIAEATSAKFKALHLQGKILGSRHILILMTRTWRKDKIPVGASQVRHRRGIAAEKARRGRGGIVAFHSTFGTMNADAPHGASRCFREIVDGGALHDNRTIHVGEALGDFGHRRDSPELATF